MKKLSNAEIAIILDKRKMAGDMDGELADLIYADLEDADLEGVDLDSVDLSRSSLGRPAWFQDE